MLWTGVHQVCEQVRSVDGEAAPFTLAYEEAAVNASAIENREAGAQVGLRNGLQHRNRSG
jgi:hypothetical protein